MEQHLDHLPAGPSQVRTQARQHPGGYTVALADQAQQDVFGADVVLAELECLAVGRIYGLGSTAARKSFEILPRRSPVRQGSALWGGGRAARSQVRRAVLVRGAEHDRGAGGDTPDGADLLQQVL